MGDEMKYDCETCAYRCVPIHASPCCNCMDGSKYEPIKKEGKAE